MLAAYEVFAGHIGAVHLWSWPHSPLATRRFPFSVPSCPLNCLNTSRWQI